MVLKKSIRDIAPGIAFCLLIAVPAWFLGEQAPVVGGPVFAILIGIMLSWLLSKRANLGPGVAYVSKKILQAAVVFLGFGMNLNVIAATGIQSLPIIVSTICTSLLIAFMLFKLLKMPSNSSILIGVGSSICGGSAIAATAPVINADDEEIAQSISVIFLFNVIAALLFPTLGQLLGLSNEGFGIFAGTAVNDTSSVTAAASAWDAVHGSNTLSTAAIVKMTRTLAIIPINLILIAYRAKKTASAGKASVNIRKIFPYFILYFVMASVVTTVCTSIGVPSGVFAPFKTLSKFLIVMAMAAIGLHTDLRKLIRSGGKPIFMGFCCWVGIACVSLLMQHVMGIW